MEQEKLSAAIRKSEGQIRAYIAHMIGDAGEADDLAQETFARAQAGWDTFRGESKVTTWLYSIATNVCLDFLKSARHRRLVATAPEVLAEIAEDDEAGPRFSAALLHDQAEMGECVRRFIDELPPDHRMTLLLHDIEEMTNREVAEALGCSVATTKIRLHRARGRLRALLEEKCIFGRDARGVFVCEPKPLDEEPPA